MTTITIVDNKKCKLETEDKQLILGLREQLFYVEPGYEYSPAAREHGWNGKRYLITTKNVFSMGLLSTVESYLKSNNIIYNLIDKRKPISSSVPLDISEKLKKLGMSPRQHQIDVLEATKNNNIGIIKSPTSSGKTLIAAMITAHINKPTVIMVIGLDLMQQFHDLFKSIFDEPIGMVGGGNCEIHRINIATVWTLGKALKVDKADLKLADDDMQAEIFDENNTDKILKMLETSKTFMLDECHIAGAATIKNIHKFINPEHIYGLSGTPFKAVETEIIIKNYFGEKIADISTSDLIRLGHIAQPIIKVINVPIINVMGKTYAEVYKEYIVENDIRNKMILYHTQQLLEKKYTILVLFKTIAHGNVLFENFKEAGIKCALLSGKDNLTKRTEIKKQINDKKIDVIIASTIFDIGLDVPILSALVMASGGASTSRIIQRVGRVIRKYPGKKNAAIIDFYDNMRYLKKHSKVRIQAYQSEDAFKLILPKDMK